jgi:hypothetical protein
MISETLVDWLKHAFITKFNHIRPSVYERYTDVLCRDLASGSRLGARKVRWHRRPCLFLAQPATPPPTVIDLPGAQHTYVDQSPLVARRLGFASLPLAVLTILIGSQSLSLVLGSTGAPFAFSFAEGVPGGWWEAAWWATQLQLLDWAAVARWAKWSTLGLAFWVWCVDPPCCLPEL